MKTILLCLTVLASVAELTATAVEPSITASTTISARDGFTRGSAMILFTWMGHTQKVEKDVVLSNGLRVGADGAVVLPNGEKASLKNNQLLTPDGVFEDVALTPDGLAPVTTAGSSPSK